MKLRVFIEAGARNHAQNPKMEDLKLPYDDASRGIKGNFRPFWSSSISHDLMISNYNVM